MTAEAPPNELDLSDEVEGEQDGTTDFVFRLVGDPIPLLPTTSSPLPLFDLHSPPSSPLAASDRLAAVFLAHPHGFMVARTKDLIEASKEAREKGKESPRCARDCCIADVLLPGVSLLALSRDESLLAAGAGGEIQFFSTASLLSDKEVKPSSSCSLGGSGVVKDFKWLNHTQASYVVLSDGGLLYHGCLGEELQNVMENVDAVDCCKDRNYIVVARNNTLSILSSDFKEKCCMSLLFQLWSSESDAKDTIKVDSIGWVRDDSIVVGCVRLNEGNNEEGYLVQVIRSGGNTFFESSSKPAVFSYPDFFRGIMDDILPSGLGPHLLLSYLHRWELMVASNKKSIDEHIVLLKWSFTSDDKKTVVYLDMLEDKYSPRIDLQENGEDNVILGFGVENVSLFQKITVMVGPEQKEVAPQHVLFCLTGEGKLIVYYVARISDPSDLPRSNLSIVEDGDDDVKQQLSTAIISENDMAASVARPIDNSLLKEQCVEPSSAQADRDEHGSINVKSSSSAARNKDIVGNSSSISSNQKLLNTNQVNAAPALAPAFSLAPTGNLKPGISFGFSTANNVGVMPTGSKAFSGSVPSWQASSSSSVNSQLGKGDLGPVQLEGVLGGCQASKKDGSSFGFKSSVFISDRSLSSTVGERIEAGFGGQLSHPPQTSYSSDKKVFSFSPSPLNTPTKLPPLGSSSGGIQIGNAESLPTARGSPSLSKEVIGKPHYNRAQVPVDHARNFKTGTILDPEQDLSAKFYSINSMTKELDTLLSYIEKDGGFRDACIAFQQRPLSMFEDGLQHLLELAQIFKSKVAEQRSKIEDLRSKMFQVSARQAYMKGIVSQSSDSQYWEIWNCQKLSPEFEVKRQNILKANKNLTNQLIELERHFNNLEMNKSGETGRVASRRNAVYADVSRSSHTQLYSVHNALNSQLAAAEQLSECLSKQIAALNISSPSMKRGAVKKELFESIGLVHEADATEYSDDTASKSVKRYPMKEQAKSILGPSKSSEPETARRRRESLDRSLASLEPQKTTVKRIVQQQRLKVISDSPFRSNKKIFDSQMAAIYQAKSSGSPTSSIVGSYVSRSKSQSEVLHEKPSKPSTRSQQNSLFKWVKEPAGSSQGTEQKYLELPGQMTSASQPSKLMPSSPVSFSNMHTNTRENTTSSSAASIRTTQTGHKSNSLTFKVTTTPKINANMQPEITPSMTSAKISQSPLAVKTLTGELGGQSTLMMKNKQDDTTLPSSGNTKQLGVPSQNLGGVFRNINALPLSSEPSKPVMLDGKTAQLSGATEAVQNPVKTTSLVAPQPPALSSTSIVQSSSSFSTVQSNISSSATLSSPATQASATKTSTMQMPTVSTIFPPQAMPKTSVLVLPEGSVDSSPPSVQTSAKESSSGLNKDISKPEVVTSDATGPVATASVASSISAPESKPSLLPVTSGSSPSTPVSVPLPATSPPVDMPYTRKDAGPSSLSSDEDDMEEEAPSTSVELNIGTLGGFGLGSLPSSSPQKSNPFGGTFNTFDNKSTGSPFTLTTSPGQLFRPASLSIPSAQPAQSSQSTGLSTFSSSFSSGLGGFGQPAQIGAGQQSGFGQPAQIGAVQQPGFGQPAQIGAGQQSGFGQPAHIGAQQALGSVLGSFGQSRQLGSVGAGGFGGFAPAAASGGFASLSSSNDGFASAATGGGFVAASGGFAAAATGGGFAALASKGGGFAGAASAGGGFGGAAQGGGFGTGGFGAFGSNQGGGFSAFGGSAAGAGRPPADLLTQMRK